MCLSNYNRFPDRARYWSKIVIFYTPPPLGGFPSEYRYPVWYGKKWNGVAIRWCKNFEDMFIRFDVIHERDGQTDGRTDGQCMTAKTALMHRIAR